MSRGCATTFETDDQESIDLVVGALPEYRGDGLSWTLQTEGLSAFPLPVVVERQELGFALSAPVGPTAAPTA
jgi:hypothetical protein